MKRLCYFTLIVMYIGCMILLPIITINSGTTAIVLGIPFPVYNLNGIIVEIHVAILIFLVIIYEKTGYTSAIMLGTLSVIIKCYAIFRYEYYGSFTGIVMVLFALMINTVLYNYTKKLTLQNDKLKQYNFELGNKQETLHRLAYFDYLTSLPNRRHVLKTINDLCSDKMTEEFSLVVIDIKNFKKINDISGHQRGDYLLKQLVETWGKLLDKQDILGRIDGDSFALIIPRYMSTEELVAFCEQLKSCVEKIISLDANIGIACYPTHSANSEDMLKFAETALSFARESTSSNILLFDQQMYHAMLKKSLIENELMKALDKNELHLVYQPQYHADGKTIRGVETLARWNNHKFGSISPYLFITLAEETGFILELGKWILKKACTEILPYATDEFSLAVNVSALQLLNSDFVPSVKQILAETGFPPDKLEIEITESIYINGRQKISTILSELKTIGIQITLDDFGTNYSSLSYLKDLPIDVIKIDKSFIDTIDNQSKKAALVDAILAIASLLGFQVVAEGVETKSQFDYLIERNCDYIQGYLLSKPIPLDQLDLLLTK